MAVVAMEKGAVDSENVTVSGGAAGVWTASRSWAEMPGSCGGWVQTVSINWYTTTQTET